MKLLRVFKKAFGSPTQKFNEFGAPVSWKVPVGCLFKVNKVTVPAVTELKMLNANKLVFVAKDSSFYPSVMVEDLDTLVCLKNNEDYTQDVVFKLGWGKNPSF
jgi:hypothetical protein